MTMQVQLELWHLISLGLVLASAFAGLAKLLLMQFERRIDSHLDALAVESAGWRNVERDLLELRAELPVSYVRREDYIRGKR